jgi:hypothetical protein
MDGRRLRTQSSRFLKPNLSKSVTFVLDEKSEGEETNNLKDENLENLENNNNLSQNNNNEDNKTEKLEEKPKTKGIRKSVSFKQDIEDNNKEKKGPVIIENENENENENEKKKKKKLGRYDSFGTRTTSIFRIGRKMHKDEENENQNEPKEFVYANILRRSGEEEEYLLDEKIKSTQQGEGVHYQSEVSYLESEYKNKLLTDYKTNDLFYYGFSEKRKLSRINKRVVGCGIFLLIIIMAIIAAIFALIPSSSTTANKIFDHSKVYVTLSGPKPGICQYVRKCEEGCNVYIEQQLGCCVGCAKLQTDPLDNDCNFNVTVGWFNVTAMSIRQRVYLFVSIDGQSWYQSGFAPPAISASELYNSELNNTKTIPVNQSIPQDFAIIPDGCFSVANQQIVLAACLSQYDLYDFSFSGFPAAYCNSFKGICVNTNDAIIKNTKYCVDGNWIGNNITSEQEWNQQIQSICPLLNPNNLSHKPKVQIETESKAFTLVFNYNILLFLHFLFFISF